MAKEKNPFVLPGFGQQGEAGQNPLFAGLEMMNQAWQGLAKGSQVNATPSMSIDDLDKKIRELQTVHNWLQLNSTMLANTIQGLEIQRSTLTMMKSFAAGAAQTDAKPAATNNDNAEYAQIANDWWNLLQQQFEQVTEATAASLQSMATTTEDAKPAKKTAKTSKPAAKKSTKSAASKTAKTTSKKTGKT